MNEDMTIVYYSASLISSRFGDAIRAELLKAAGGTPIISVTHKPLDFGVWNIVMDLPQSVWSIYRQILTGAIAANTKFVACAEDDSTYLPEHFATRPPDDETFIYNRNRWWIEYRGNKHYFRFRDRTGMHTCIVNRELLIDTLEKRFVKFPGLPPQDEWGRYPCKGFGEPGRSEHILRLPRVKMGYFRTTEPLLTFAHKPSMGNFRKISPLDVIQDTLPPWGSARELWERIYGD